MIILIVYLLKVPGYFYIQNSLLIIPMYEKDYPDEVDPISINDYLI